ncbi:MAG TPA: transposase family protein [Candidatus Bathyarchaeia archaeon]|nr:transposase family protein [Candidatus Bathyarchaeia archaeon]
MTCLKRSPIFRNMFDFHGYKLCDVVEDERKIRCMCGYRGVEKLDFVDKYSFHTTRFEEYVSTLSVQPAVTPSPALPPSATPLITPPITPAPTPVQTPEATPTPEEPGFEAILWLFAVALVVLIGYLNTSKRRK